MTNTPYESLKPAGSGGGINGVAVSATKGGSVLLVGDDYDNMESADIISVRANLCLDGYEFVGWYLASDTNTCLSTQQSERFKKSQIYETQLIAFFRPIGSNATLDDTLDNQ